MKDLDRLPPRILRFRLHLDRFSYNIKHVPGKELYTADMLSRAPVTNQAQIDSTDLHELADLCMVAVIANPPASSQCLQTYNLRTSCSLLSVSA